MPRKGFFISDFKKLPIDRQQETFSSSEQDGKRKEMKGGEDQSVTLSVLHFPN